MDETESSLRGLFNRALDIEDAQQRAAYLAEACAGDEALLRKLKRLLDAHDKAGGFLGAAPGPDNTTCEDASDEEIGSVIGRYKLLQKIGEGGCGVVYMAEQSEPVRRRVALKVIKLGMDTKQVIARFEAERQALALMEHPNIARVFDAGATEMGRPYFVMELVRGVKITEYCDEARLSTEQRLALFMQVCQAVQHAHQKGIIHRDLKPSNVLVTVNDGVALPKVIDFGIAKATTGQPLTGKTIFTAFEQFIGTPAYMSPEQAVMTSVDIDTRSDIYSLGVLLYELLTGSTPFDTKQLLAAGLDEMRRTIREREPQRPSTRLSTLPGDELSTTAQRRAIQPPRLITQLRGDLDWILMKCLEKDRARRYETANGLARDIERHLNEEPVVACPPSKAYLFQKLIRRNRMAFVAAGAVAASLLLGFGISTWMFFQERAAKREQAHLRLQAQAKEAKAEIAAVKSEQETHFLEDMLQGVGPSVAMGRDTTVLREILDKSADRISAELTNQPEVEVDLRNTMGGVYRELGEFGKAEAQHRRALETATRTFGESHESVAKSLGKLASCFYLSGRLSEAEASAREALTIATRLFSDGDPRLEGFYNGLAVVLMSEDQRGDANVHDEADALYLKALAIVRRRGDKEELAATLHNLAILHRTRTTLAESETFAREALEIEKKLAPNGNPGVAYTLECLGETLRREGKLDEAESYLSECLALRKRLLPGNHPMLASSASALARVLSDQKKFEQAEGFASEALEVSKRAYGQRHPYVAGYLSMLMNILLHEGKFQQAERLVNEPLSSTSDPLPSDVQFLSVRVDFLARMGRWTEAIADCRRAIAVAPTNHLAYHDLAPLLVKTADLSAYREHCQQEVVHYQNTRDVAVAHTMSKDCLILSDSGVSPLVVASWASTALAAGTNYWGWRFLMCAQALVEYRNGNFTEAIEWAKKVISQTSPEPEYGAQAYAVLAMAQFRTKDTEAAHEALSQGLELANQKTSEAVWRTGESSWREGIIAHTLLQEASALIEGSNVANQTK